MQPVRLSLRLSALGVLSALALSLAGCSLVPPPAADPTRYYVLTGPVQENASEAQGAGSVVLGVKRIEIAPYLNGKDMVVRKAGNEITYNSFSRWAEPLTTSISRALAGRLAGSEKVARVYSQPFPFEVERDYDVSVRVLRCEGDIDADGKASVSFSALVEVTQANAGGGLIMRKVFTATETDWDGRNFGALATGLSEAVAALSAEIAAALPAK